MQDDRRRVYAIDVGSTRSNAFAWARTVGSGASWRVEGNASIETFLDVIVADLRAGAAVSLGFEAPMYIPVPLASADLSRARAGEATRAWSAPTGLAVTALGLHQMCWIMRSLAEKLEPLPEFTVDWQRWRHGASPVLYVWEAFVSAGVHARGGGDGDHLRDAGAAANSFRARAWEQLPASDLGVGVSGTPALDVPVLSLAAVAAQWAGWPVDDHALRTRLLVLRPTERFLGEVQSLAP